MPRKNHGRGRRRLTALALCLAAPASLAFALGAGKPATQLHKGGKAIANPPVEDAVLLDAVGGVASDHVLVRVKPGVSPRQLADGRWTFATQAAGDQRMATEAMSIAGVMTQRGVTGISLAMKTPAGNPALAAQLGIDRFYRVDVPAGTNTPALVAELKQFTSLIEIAEADGIGGVAEVIPNDTHFDAQQYALRNTGQMIGISNGVVDADVDASDAWDITTGSDSITLAVIDSGVDPHVDLAGRLLTGWNVISNDTNTADVCNHGTHVTGIAAANGNNGQGIAGMDWNVKILPVRAFTSACSGPESDIGNAIKWAADNGADVINMSLQYYAGTAFLESMVEYADALRVVMVAATGNNNQAFGVAYPARWPEPIAVGATTNQDVRWTGSNPGPQIDVCAPGRDVYSTIGASGYMLNTGTSMATPHVSGLVCLMLSIRPTLNTEQIRSILETTADDKDVPGFDDNTGFGRINAKAALDKVVAFYGPGDINHDGVVDIEDFSAVTLAWGPCAGYCDEDLNNDGEIDIDDFSEVVLYWD